MADTNINIIFRNGAEPGNESNPEKPGSTPTPEDPTEQKENAGKGASFSTKAMALYIGKQALNMASSRVGQVTGNSLLQEKVNATLKIVAYAGAIAINPVMGALAIGVDVVNQTLDYGINANKEATSLELLNMRAGNVNRSR